MLHIRLHRDLHFRLQLQLQSFTILYNPLQSFTILCNPLQSFTWRLGKTMNRTCCAGKWWPKLEHGFQNGMLCATREWSNENDGGLVLFEAEDLNHLHPLCMGLAAIRRPARQSWLVITFPIKQMLLLTVFE